MAVKLRIPKTGVAKWFASPWKRAFLATALGLTLVGGGVFIYYYSYYAHMIEDRLQAGPFNDMSVLYAARKPVISGESIEPAQIAAYLRRTGYTEDSNRSRIGWYRLRPDAIEVNPGPDAFDSEGAVIKVAGGKVS